MTYWLYNMGLAVPVRDDRLQARRNVESLTPASKSAELTYRDEGGLLGSWYDKQTLTPHSAGPLSPYQQSSPNTRSPVFFARDIMSSPVVTLTEELIIAKAWGQFEKHRFRHFPVVNNENRLVGIISDRDMLLRAVQVGNESKVPHSATSINQIMKKSVLTASGDTNIREICQMLFNQHIGAMPITDGHGSLLGIITRSDILRTIIKNEPFELWV